NWQHSPHSLQLHLSHRHHFKMLSQLESAMDNIIKVFYKYSGKEGDKYTLTKAELKDLLKGELEAFLKVNNNISTSIGNAE
ncbi:hypothetical protein chiPu_0025679, partial [Chiloscyllium punctatum]|nr:hypothetical protein [Chiloscyllium punctatum]